MEMLDFLDTPVGVDEPIAAPAPEAEAPPTPEAVAPEPPEPVHEDGEGQPRGPDGKFLPKAEPQAAPPAPEPAPRPAEPAPEVGGLTKALLDERDRRQAAEAEIARLKATQPQQPTTPPDEYEDPEGYKAHQQQLLDDRFQKLEKDRVNDRLNSSEKYARKEYGSDVVTAAKTWGLERGAQDPSFAQQVLRDADPYELIVSEYKRHTALQALQDPAKLAAFEAWQAALAAPPAPAPAPEPIAAAPAVPAPPPPPRSIIHQPSAGGGKPGEQPVGSGVAFDSVFPK